MAVDACTEAKILAKKAIKQCVETASNHPDFGLVADIHMSLIDIYARYDKRPLKDTELALTLLLAKLTVSVSKAFRTQLTRAKALVTYAIKECE